MMLQQMPAELFSKVAQNVLRCQGCIQLATLCTGCSVALDVLDMWEQLLKSAIGSGRVHFGIQYCCSFEWSARKRLFLEQTSPRQPELVFGDVRVLQVSDEAVDLRSGSWATVPTAHLLVAGFECDSVSMLNRRRAQFRECINLQQGSTGQTFAAVLCYIRRHRPTAAIFENVRSFAAAASAEPRGAGTKRKRSGSATRGLQSNLAKCAGVPACIRGCLLRTWPPKHCSSVFCFHKAHVANMRRRAACLHLFFSGGIAAGGGLLVPHAGSGRF